VEVTSPITGDTTWDCRHLWRVHQAIDVAGPGGLATLTVEPGTVVELGVGPSGELGALLVSRTGRLVAEGTAELPITFTSDLTASGRGSGDWGGIVLSGRARTSVPGGEGSVNALMGSGSAATTYGGGASPDDAWECGRLRYLRIQFSGAVVRGGTDRLAALTLAGCGTGTVVDHLQTHRTADDGLTIYGGRVDLRHVLVSAPEEETLDWNYGWDGRVQFLLAWQLPAGAGGQDAPGASLFEADSSGFVPHSSPTLFNVTALLAPDARDPPLLLRTETEALIANSILDARAAGANVAEICGDATAALATGPMPALRIDQSLLTDRFANPERIGCVEPFDERAWACASSVCEVGVLVSFGPATSPSFGTTGMLRRMYSATPTDPADGRPAFFDTTASYCGAIGPSDWTLGWTEFPAS
jgi:hypothetical protein